MKPGDLYWAYVPFRHQEGGKRRPVLVLHVPAGGGTPVVVESTSKYKPSLKLVKAINFDLPKYRSVSLKGVSYFYFAGLRELSRDCFDQSPVGQLAEDDLRAIMIKLNSSPG